MQYTPPMEQLTTATSPQPSERRLTFEGVACAVFGALGFLSLSAPQLHWKDVNFFHLAALCFLSLSAMASIPLLESTFNTLFTPPEQPRLRR
jgi:hypothetical protein